MCGIFINFSKHCMYCMWASFSLHFPLKSRLYVTKRKVRVICIVYWIIAIIWALIDQRLSLLQTSNAVGLCWTGEMYTDNILNVIAFVVFFTMSLLVFVFACFRRSKGHHKNKTNQNEKCQIDTSQNGEIDNIDALDKHDKRVKKKELQGHGIKTSLEGKTVRILVSCMLVYYILYLPAEVTLFLDLGAMLMHISYIMLAGNSLINPVFYWKHPMFNEAYRKTLQFVSK